MSGYDFANLLFGGPCNLACPDCIGRAPGSRWPDSLGAWPPPGLGAFLDRLRAEGVRELAFSGVNTDPLLYRPLGALIDLLRRALPGVRLSVHTNGVLALRRRRVLGRIDRLSLSLPSFRPETCRRMTGSARVLDLAAILEAVEVPIKVSVLMTEHNRQELPDLLARLAAMGIRRAVLRRRVGARDEPEPLPGLRPIGQFGGNPVYDLDGLELSVWDFERTRLACLNLMPDGGLLESYRLPGVPSSASMPGSHAEARQGAAHRSDPG
jgi:cyclic pyranopterin phosphate synthase